MSARELPCDTCEGVVLFEAPPCGDGHGVDCPELICTGCGTAILIAPHALRPSRRPARRAAHRHAA
ncbi:hypothetical protein CO540_27805 [Micromonospora sp. WMMA2032]|uniref:hypothetical protein n=1 Tax=Micromonospora sp. WMMA2032 TaxID=2039870 RepID=UPI000C059905|nr:hypothetical protein [Micromonospora sp. WMMA2032]ATO17167.1 hypothetical protein CO540_27805 [Micromonospora sp. WMMA2032]